MKTVFITSFHPHISRNIFATKTFELLKGEKDLRIIILCPDYKREYFAKNFGGGNIIVEGVAMYSASKTGIGLFFKRLALYMMPSATRRIKQRHKLYEDKNYPHFVFFMLANFLGQSFLFRRFTRFADFKLSPSNFFAPIFDKYKPDAVFATDIQDENDTTIMQEAKKRGVPVIGMFRSWDNPTHGIFRIFPDKFLAGSRAIAEEAAFWQGYPKKNIIITGHPHYDKYLNGPTKTKEAFFREFGLDINKRLILFTPLGDKFVRKNDIDQYTLEVLKILPANEIQILVRFPPDEPVTLENFEKPANMIFHRPGFAFSDKFEDREIRTEDDDSLINEIYWSDIVITGPTSINLDAAFFDKPIIASNLMPSRRKYFETDYCFDFTHIRNMLGTGGAAYVQTKTDLLYQIKKYLKDPKLDFEGRAEIRALWFSHADGKAGERVAGEVLKFVDSRGKSML